MPQLDPSSFPSQLFWLFVSFVVLYTLLSRLILPPLQGVITQRAKTIETDIELAQECKTLAEHARADYERVSAEARTRAQKLMSDTMLDHEEKSEARLLKLDVELASQLAHAQASINTKKQQLLKEMLPASVDVAAMIIDKLTNQTVSADTLKRMVDELSKESR